MIDPYTVLGVSPTASPAEITHAFRHQLRDHHPDLQSGVSNSVADERLRQILAAYALLRDPLRRRDYDRSVARVRKAKSPNRITVSHIDSGDDEPPMWAGPVRWHR